MRTRRIPALRAGLVATLILTALFEPGAAGALGAAEAHELKAAFLFNFARFVDWPVESGALVLCTLGEDAVTGVLDGVEGRTVQDRTLHLRRIADASGFDECDVLYVSGSEASRLASIARALRATRGMLTVSDIEGFTDAGGMIEFVVEAKRVRFDVNVAAARQSRVEISSKLLRLARRVRGDTP